MEAEIINTDSGFQMCWMPLLVHTSGSGSTAKFGVFIAAVQEGRDVLGSGSQTREGASEFASAAKNALRGGNLQFLGLEGEGWECRIVRADRNEVTSWLKGVDLPALRAAGQAPLIPLPVAVSGGKLVLFRLSFGESAWEAAEPFQETELTGEEKSFVVLGKNGDEFYSLYVVGNGKSGESGQAAPLAFDTPDEVRANFAGGKEVFESLGLELRTVEVKLGDFVSWSALDLWGGDNESYILPRFNQGKFVDVLLRSRPPAEAWEAALPIYPAEEAPAG